MRGSTLLSTTLYRSEEDINIPKAGQMTHNLIQHYAIHLLKVAAFSFKIKCGKVFEQCQGMSG